MMGYCRSGGRVVNDKARKLDDGLLAVRSRRLYQEGMSSPTLRILIVVLAVAAQLTASCGADEAAQTTLHLEPLHLESQSTTPANDTIEFYRRLRPSPSAPWTIKRGEAELVLLEQGVEGEGERYALELRNCTGTRILLRGPFDGREFDAVAMEIECDQATEFTLSFLAMGESSPSTARGKASSTRQPGRQLLQFEFPALYLRSEEIKRLRLSTSDRLRTLRIHSVDLLRRSRFRGLPSPPSEPGLLLVAGEKRRGVGISSESGVRSRSTIEANSVLRFSYAAPGQGPGAKDAAAFELTIRTQSGRSQDFRFHPDGAAEFHWHDVRLALDAFAGGKVEFNWRVDGKLDDVWALAEVGVLRGTAPPRRVLLITSDTHRADHLGSAGAGIDVRTPELDALAARGILFEDCYSATNVTNPSHVSLMTATHPRDTGVLTNNQPLSGAAPTLAEAFHQAGFATFASLSARHLGDRTSGLGQGFDRVSEPHIAGMRRGETSVDAMQTWVDANPDVPLFLWLHLFDAHTPYDPPAAILESYYPDAAAAFDPSAASPAETPTHVYGGMFPGLKDLDYPRALYAGEVTYMDRELQRMLRHPLMEQAVVAFTADHGESLGQHGIFYVHADLYPDSLHIPLILSFPDGPRGERLERPVRLIDLGRTLLDLANEVAVEFPGNNLLAEADERIDAAPRFAIATEAGTASISVGGWHLLLYLAPAKERFRVQERERHQAALFHLDQDPGCEQDLAEIELERTKALRRRLIDWLDAARDQGWRETRVTDAETLRSLAALGYTQSAESEVLPIDFFPADCSCAWCSRFGD